MSMETFSRTEMSDDSPEHRERDAVIEFEEYRRFCDETDFFRRLGVLEQEAYEKALNDPRTSFLVFDGHRVPALIPLEYESRYSTETSKEMTGSAEVVLLAVPFKELESAISNGVQLERGAELGEDFSIIVEDYDNEMRTEEGVAKLKEALSGFGDLAHGDFIDERLNHLPENKTAWMAIYDFVIESNRPANEIIREGTAEERVIEAWRQYREEHEIPELPSEDFNGTFFFSAEQLRENPGIVAQLWSISEVGFGNNLGKYHPISMAVSKNFFNRHITTDGTFVSVKYIDGEAQCFGFVAPSMEHNEWLNEQSDELRRVVEGSETGEEMVAHFFELISKGARGMGLASDLLILLQDIASRASERTRVAFESTGLSDCYVPSESERTANENPSVTLTQRVVKRDTLHYSYLKSQ